MSPWAVAAAVRDHVASWLVPRVSAAPSSRPSVLTQRGWAQLALGRSAADHATKVEPLDRTIGEAARGEVRQRRLGPAVAAQAVEAERVVVCEQVGDSVQVDRVACAQHGAWRAQGVSLRCDIRRLQRVPGRHARSAVTFRCPAPLRTGRGFVPRRSTQCVSPLCARIRSRRFGPASLRPGRSVPAPAFAAVRLTLPHDGLPERLQAPGLAYGRAQWREGLASLPKRPVRRRLVCWLPHGPAIRS
jgi:hypothetical protein